MGKTKAWNWKPTKKRKKNTESTDQSTDLNSSQEPPSVSELLKEANRVLYENTPVFNYDNPSSPNHPPITSTPLNKSGGLSIDNKLDLIMKKLESLDSIVEAIKRLDGRVSQMESRVNLAEVKSADFEKSVDFVSNKVDEFDKKCSEVSTVVAAQVKKQQQLEKSIDKLEKRFNVTTDTDEVKELRDTVLDLKCRSMKNNLVFTGLGGETNNEDTERRLRDFIYHELEIESNIEFDNVHRFGRFYRGKDRPIVARFLYHGDLVHVLKNAHKLQGKSYGIHEQFPKEIEDRRRLLYPIQKRCRKAGQKTKLVRDKLFIDGKLYEPQDPAVTTESARGASSA